MFIRIFKRKRTIQFFLILFILCSKLSNNVYADNMESQRNVLIINSYHQGFTWTNDEVTGIMETLKKYYSNSSIFVEYMDWKNHPSVNNIQFMYDYFLYKYKDKNIDIIIATDDIALKFALKNRSELFSDAPLVFCGVNQNGAAQITQGYDNFTGVIEEIDPADTIKMALEINPALKNIYVLFDNSESGLSTGELVMNKIRALNMGLGAIPLNTLPYEDIIANAASFNIKDSIILVTTYYSDVNGKIIEFEAASRELGKNSSVPVYHLFDLGLNNGAFGGSMMCGTLQGMNAADMAIRILNGEKADSIPLLSQKTIRRVFDFQQLRRFNIPLKRIPKDIEIVNMPFSFFETYKTLVLSVLTAFIILITFVCILLFYIKQINKMKKNLSDSHEELTQIYEELAASDEELKQQYEEVLINNEKIIASEEKLVYLAYHDTLTGLMNKLSLFEGPNKGIFVSANYKAALLFIDMDNFKYINDIMGHDFGDKLIIKVSERLISFMKENCYIYRFGGDEFIIIIQNIKRKEDAEIFASRILAGFKEEFNILNSILHVSLSIGIVEYPEHGKSIEELLKYADIAMYKAKGEGRNRYVLYNEQMNKSFTERANIEKFLNKAIDKNEFELFYQPQLDLYMNKITGLEALLRWKSLELGNVSPLKFIKVAEDTHFIIPLGTWVLRNACAFLKKLHKKRYKDMSISVNISILQLMQNDFVDMVMDILEFYEIEPEFLELEITESILIESFEAVGIKLEKLKSNGVRIALDDFGKGYSSLSYLKQIPISTLKIDKSFIDNICIENESRNLTGQIVMIGKNMGINVIAEGVESQEQLDYLARYGCNKIQGYLFSKPIPEVEIEELLKKEKNQFL